MNKNDIIIELAQKAEITNAQALKVYTSMLEIYAENLLQGQKVMLSGFGVLLPIERKGRQISHPKTGEILDVKTKKTVKFKPSQQFIDKLNQ